MNAVTIKHRIAELAESQHGLITRTQSYELGATRAALNHLRETGVVVPVGKHAFRVRGAPPKWRQRALAMVLQSGGLTVVSHRSAAALWRLPGMKETGRIHVTQLRTHSHDRRMPRIHQAPWLRLEHVRHVDGIPVIAPAPLLFQLAAAEHPKYLERLIDHALMAPLATPRSLDLAVATLCRKGRPGSRIFRELVAERTTEGYVATASELEAEFLRLVRAEGLPEPIRQQNVGGAYWVARVDFALPGLPVVVELDGRRYHTALLDKERDRIRDIELVRFGRHPVHLTWHDLKKKRAWVAELLRDLMRPVLAA